MMKLIMSLLAYCLMMVTSCVHIDLGNKIEPSDNIVEKEYTMDPFTKLDIDAVANIKFVQSTEGDYRVCLKAPENYVELFDFSVDDKELEIGFVRNNINIESKNVKIIVYAPVLHELENSGVAGVTIDSLKCDMLKIENSGVGTLKLQGLSINKMIVDCSGVGNIELSGSADKVSLKCSGVGNVAAKDLKARYVQGEVTGVGGIECYAYDSLKATVSGVGALKYAGQPHSKNLHRTGVGNISEL